MSPHRITKKEIKQDKFVTFSLKLSEWIQAHLNQVLMVAGALVVVVVAVVFIFSSQAKRERKAAELFGQANVELQSGNIGAAVSSLQMLVTKYSGSKHAGQATYYLASAYFYAKDYTQSQTWFEKYLKDYGQDVLLASAAQAGIADCQMERGNHLQAAESLTEAVSMNPSGFLAPQYLLKASQAYLKAGQENQAKETLNRLLSEYPDSKESHQAKLKLAEIS